MNDLMCCGNDDPQAIQTTLEKPKLATFSVISMALLRARPKLPLLLRPIAIAAHIFGVSLTSLPQRKWLVYLSVSYTVLQFLFATGLSLYRIGYIQPKFCQQNPVSHTANGIQQLLGVSVVIAVYYQTLFRRTDVQMVLKLLAKSHNDLLQLNLIAKYRVLGIKIVVETILVLLFVCSAFVVFAIHYDVTSGDALVLEYISTMNPLLLTDLMLLMFINICWHIRNELCILRKMMEELVTYANDDDIGGDDRVWTIRAYDMTPKMIAYRLHCAARIFATLFDATQAINRIFGLSNLTSMGETSIQMNEIEKR